MARSARPSGTTVDSRRSPTAVAPILDGLGLAGGVLLLHRPDLAGIAFTALALILLTAARTRPSRIWLDVGEDLAGIVGRIAVAVVVIAPFTAGTFMPLLRAAILSMAFVTVGRRISYGFIRTMRSRGVGVEPTLIVGSGTIAASLAHAMRIHPEYGLQPVGFVDTADGRDLPLPIVGPVEEIASLVELYGARRVVVAFGASREPDLVKVLRACDRLPVEIHVVPRFYELGVATDVGADEIAGIPIPRLHRAAHRAPSWPLKRALDIAVSGFALILSAPLLAACAAAVKLSSPGPVLFRQHRLGEGARIIEIRKFRTMRVNDDSDTQWSVANDDRLTRIGRILRQTHLDELPQLLNVLRGDMTLVGPRPERPYFAELFSAEVAGYNDRHRVPVGITGWAQVHGLNGDTSIEERVRFDNRYIERWSLWRDLVIIARTGASIITGFRSDGEALKRQEAEAAKQDRVVDLRTTEIDLRTTEIDVGTSEIDLRTSANGSAAEGSHANGSRNGSRNGSKNGARNGARGNGHAHPAPDRPARP